MPEELLTAKTDVDMSTCSSQSLPLICRQTSNLPWSIKMVALARYSKAGNASSFGYKSSSLLKRPMLAQ